MELDADTVGIIVMVERPPIDFPVEKPHVYHTIDDVPPTPLPSRAEPKTWWTEAEVRRSLHADLHRD